MKLSNNTLAVLKNFSQINPGLVVNPGNVLRTISSSKAILAQATLEESFEKGFGLYDLSKLLSVLSMYEDPELHFTESNVLVGNSGTQSKTRLRFTDPKIILTPADKPLNIGEVHVSFTLHEKDLAWVEKIGSALGCPNLVFTNENGRILAKTMDVKGAVTDESELDVGPYTDLNQFKFTLKVENLKLLPGSYQVDLASKGVARFTHKTNPLVYWVAVVQAHSEFKRLDQSAD